MGVLKWMVIVLPLLRTVSSLTVPPVVVACAGAEGSSRTDEIVTKVRILLRPHPLRVTPAPVLWKTSRLSTSLAVLPSDQVDKGLPLHAGVSSSGRTLAAVSR